MKPRISIVTPSFNQGEFIEETICSVLDQGYENLEYIIIDGGSQDQTKDIIRKYERHISYWVSEPDQGQTDAINKGIKRCTGEIFNWLNSDDLLTKDSLNKVSSYFTDDVDIVSGAEIHFDSNEERFRNGTILFDTLEETLFQSVIYQPSTFWRFSKLKSIYPLDLRFRYMMDADLWFRYLLIFGLHHVKKVDDKLAMFRLHAKSKTVSQQRQFKKEFWSTRKAFFCNLGELKYSEQMEQLAANFEPQPYEVSQEIDQQFLKRMLIMALLEDFYAEGDYHQCRNLLHDFVSGFGAQDPRVKKYRVRLMLPDFLLKLIRMNHA